MFFDVGVIGDPPAVLLTATTDLDLGTLATAERELDHLPGTTVLIDMSGAFVGIRGVQLLVSTLVRAASCGVRAAVAGLPAPVLRRVDLFDGAGGLALYRTLPEAVAALSGPGQNSTDRG